MKRIGFVFVLLISQFSSYTQDYHVVDSIKQLLKQEQVQDTNSVKRYLRLGSAYVWSVPDTAIYYHNKALSLSRQLHFTRGEFSALVFRAYPLAVVREDSAAISSAYQAIAIAEALNNNQFIADAYFTLGAVYIHLKEFDKGILYHRKGLSYWGTDNPFVVQNYDEHLAQCFIGLNKTDSAFLYAIKTLADNKQLKISNGFDWYLMGNVFLQKQLPDSALKYYREGLAMVTKQHVLKDMADCNLGIANAFLQKNRLDSAIHYAKNGWIVASKTKLSNEKLDALNLLSTVFASKKNIDSAYRYQQYSLALKDSIYNAAKVRQVQLLAFNEEMRKQQESEVARKRMNANIITALLALLLFAFIIVVIIYNNNKKRKKAYALLQQQKNEIDNKNKELEIESALEKVRFRSLAMRQSDELKEVVKVVFEQLQHLGISFDFASIDLFTEDSKDLYSYTCGWSGNEFFIDGRYTPYFDHPIMNDIIEAREHSIDFHVKTYTKEEINSALQYAFEHTELKQQGEGVKAQMLANAGYTIARAFGNNCAVNINNWSAKGISNSEKNILVRFAKSFEQPYLRFLDLQQAEEHAREAQIEAALERVRSRAMAMQKSEELTEVIQVIFDQLYGLHFNLGSASFVVEIDETNDLRNWIASPRGKFASRIDLPYINHPVFNRIVEAKEKGETFYTLLLGKEKKDQFFDHYYRFAPVFSEEGKNNVYQGKGWAQSVVVMQKIALCVQNFSGIPFSAEENKTLVRFGKAFEQTYTRFLDLQRAEASAKEAQIEAALERVRSRSMGMQKSEELREVIQLILDQLCTLQFTIDSASFTVEFKESNDFRYWIAAPGQQYASLVNLPYLNNPVFNKWLEANRKRENFLSYTMSKEEKDHFFDHFINSVPGVPEERKHFWYNSAGWANSSVLMKSLSLNIQNYSGIPYSEEENKILVRFGKAFEQTYTRFLDLQKAEAAAKEALKQASIDRVRAEIASMRTTKDLDRIIPLIWNELTLLHIPFIRCGVFIVNEDAEQTQVYLSTPEGKAIATFQLPFNSDGLNKEMLQHWRNNQIFKDHWDAAAFSAWTHSLVEGGAIQPDERYSNEQPPENLYLHFVPFMQGMLYVGNTQPLSAHDLSLIESLADAFSTAYARYEDFSKLEAAKQQIETTLTELKATQSQLIQAEKMASLGELTAGIAHEIQNPLNFVNNFSEVSSELVEELKGERSKVNGERDEALEEDILNDLSQNLVKINHHGKRADAIVKGMLQHSRANSGKTEPTDLNALADEYLRLSYHGLRAKDKDFNATIETDFDESIGKIQVVPQDIGRVLLNLYNNAFYAVSERCKVERVGYKPTVWVTTKRAGDKLGITVKDNGNGIPEKVVDKIFQPFFTTKPTGQGTGLGLSLSYDIIKAHGGEIKVQTREGERAEFIIQLPI